MRKVLISLAVAASALAVATPASAQYFPAPQGNAYGYNNNYGQVRRLQARIDQIQRQITMLDRPVNQDGCQRATQRLLFSGTAVEAP